MEVRNLSGIDRDEFEKLARELAVHRSLTAALTWAAANAFGKNLPEVVAQDEFSNDVVIPWREYFIVYDTT